MTQTTNRYIFLIMLYFIIQFFINIYIFDDNLHITQRNFHKLIYIAQSILFSLISQTFRVFIYFHKFYDSHNLYIFKILRHFYYVDRFTNCSRRIFTLFKRHRRFKY